MENNNLVNKKEVECWCCKHFVLREKTETGGCINKWVVVPAHDRVCEDFELRDGLHTERTIPDYCKKCK